MPLTETEARTGLLAPGARYELTEVTVGGRPVTVYRNAPPHLRAVLESTRGFPERVGLVYQDERYTYGQMYRRVAGLAHVLGPRFGVGKGDRVVLAMRNLPEFVLMFWAVQALGAVVVPLNAWWSGRELAWAVADSGPQVLVADGARWDRLREAEPDLSVPQVVVTRVEIDPGPQVMTWEQLLELGGEREELPPAVIDPDDAATMIYTSGTTGRPKAAIGTGRNHCSLMMSMGFQAEVAALTATTPPRQHPLGHPVLLNPFPFFHIGGISSLYNAFAGGLTQVLVYKWDPEQVVRICAQEDVTAMAVVPTMLRRLLESPSSGRLDLTSVVSIGIGGSAGAIELEPLILERFGPGVTVNHGYGLTETTSSVVQHSGLAFFANPDNVGLPVPVCEVRVTLDDGTAAPVGMAGEIWVRGVQVVAGYWNNPEASEEAFVDGWFRTGDVGAFDEQGRLRLLDRIKDVIIRGGENIYSAEVEAVLGEHPAVDEVGVVGRPDADLGEVVVAFVVPKPGANIDVAELAAYAARELADFKVPTAWIVRREPLPRNASNKLLKRELRAQLPSN